METAIDPMGRNVFIACLEDTTGVEHQFSFNFATDWGAAAAHDIMLRRLCAATGSAGTEYSANFPGWSWVKLVGTMLAGAGETHFNEAKGNELQVAGGEKKKRRSDEPHRHVIGRRIYDSEYGVTCHWCRQKTVEKHVSCTAPECNHGHLPVSFCGACLRNRNGEDIDAAIDSVGQTYEEEVGVFWSKST